MSPHWSGVDTFSSGDKSEIEIFVSLLNGGYVLKKEFAPSWSKIFPLKEIHISEKSNTREATFCQKKSGQEIRGVSV